MIGYLKHSDVCKHPSLKLEFNYTQPNHGATSKVVWFLKSQGSSGRLTLVHVGPECMWGIEPKVADLEHLL